MAKISIAVTDLDLGADTYRVDFNAVGTELEEGHATSAYFVGYFLHTLISDAGFLKDVGSYGKGLVEAMQAEGNNLMPMEGATMVLTLEDEDINTGRYKANLEMTAGDSSGTRLPTTAQIMAAYMRSLIATADFQLACWEFAKAFVSEHDGRHIVNIEQAPDETAARAA